MLSKVLNNKRAARNLMTMKKAYFSHGPYNPMHYKTVLVPEGMPSTEDYYASIKSEHENPPAPVYNMRHIHPIR